MDLNRRTIIKSFFIIIIKNLGFKIKNFIKKKKFKKFVWILKDTD